MRREGERRQRKSSNKSRGQVAGVPVYARLLGSPYMQVRGVLDY
jgi:hypothetical protein